MGFILRDFKSKDEVLELLYTTSPSEDQYEKFKNIGEVVNNIWIWNKKVVETYTDIQIYLLYLSLNK